MRRRTPVLLALALGLLLTTPRLAEAEEWMDDPGASRAWTEVSRLTDEVGTLNLVNGLNLSRPQLEQIIALARETKRIRDDYFVRQEGLAFAKASSKRQR